jgi:glycosyltransferase involved in cell wall biosynthesis
VEFNPKVSIVIPVYNGANYLREAIDSALAQTYKNIEVIVVNDGSNDGGKSEEIALSYGDRIRYFRKENGGVASALNMGIREMTGEWFAWLSHDDKFSPDRIEEDINIVRANPEARIICCKTAVIDETGAVIGERGVKAQKVLILRDAMLGVGLCAMTVFRSCFEKTGLFNESNSTTQDTEMRLLLSKHYAFYFNSKAITYSREHPEGGRVKLKEQHKRDVLALFHFIRDNFANDTDKEHLVTAWAWLGDLCSSFGEYEYADECYKEGFYAQKRLFSIVGIKYVIGARKLDSSLLRLFIKLKMFVDNICRR